MFGILGVEEGALVVVEPPRQARVARVFEVDDRVLITVKPHIQKQLARTVGQSFVLEFTIAADRVEIEVAENSGGSQAVKAIVVKIYLHHPHMFSGYERSAITLGYNDDLDARGAK
jgi:hypothetical protein